MPFYTRNGKPVTADEALDPTGCIREGYSIHYSILHMDSAPSSSGASRIFMKDYESVNGNASMSETVEASVEQIPSEFLVRMQYIEGGLHSGNRFQVENAIRNAEDLIGRMSILRNGLGPGHYMGQPLGEADRINLGRASEYLSGMVRVAQARLASMGA